jgi:hypothetical protein
MLKFPCAIPFSTRDVEGSAESLLAPLTRTWLFFVAPLRDEMGLLEEKPDHVQEAFCEWKVKIEGCIVEVSRLATSASSRRPSASSLGRLVREQFKKRASF